MAPSPPGEYKQQNSGCGAEPQMQTQISTKPGAPQLQLPCEHSGDDGGRRCYGSRNQVVVGRSRERSTAAPERQQIEFEQLREKMAKKKAEKEQMISLIETMIVMEALGKALMLEPYLPTVVIAGGFLSVRPVLISVIALPSNHRACVPEPA